jgi:hypothetical protein
MLRLVNRIEECDDGLHKMRPGTSIEGITLHMFAVPSVIDAAGIASFYRQNRQWTGGQMPYTYVVLPSGVIEQALPIWEIGPHALRWSAPTIGVVHIGDFNKHAPPAEQWASSVDLVAELCSALELDPLARDAGGVHVVAGHTERPRATKAKNKDCPGKLFPLTEYREQVRDAQRESAIQRLENAMMVA